MVGVGGVDDKKMMKMVSGYSSIKPSQSGIIRFGLVSSAKYCWESHIGPILDRDVLSSYLSQAALMMTPGKSCCSDVDADVLYNDVKPSLMKKHNIS